MAKAKALPCVATWRLVKGKRYIMERKEDDELVCSRALIIECVERTSTSCKTRVRVITADGVDSWVEAGKFRFRGPVR